MLKYKLINNDKIELEPSPDLNIKQILECGQVFRYKKMDFGYEIISLNHKAQVYCQEHGTIITCDDAKYFENYFDLTRDYATIKSKLSKHKLLNSAIQYGYGIRILKQDPVETILNFIISQNNNIPRIKKIIENICESFGENMGGYYSFPTINQLKQIPLQFFKDIKTGYRDKYLFETIQMLSCGFDLNCVYNMPSVLANKYLQKLPGVGPKVADCILLYGFGKQDVFPTDTWIKKVYADNLRMKTQVSANTISNYFVGLFGDLSGIAQQYLFYSKREKNE